MPPSDAVLQIKNLAVSNDKGLGAVNNLSLDVRAGEILGIAGVSGNGQRELAEAIAGMRRVNAGTVQIAGKDVTNCSPEQVIAASVSFIPEERMVMGVVREFSVAENAILETHNRPPLSKRTFFDFKQIDAHVTKLVREYDVKTPSLETPVKSLSGGNIQKLIMARELARDPRVLIAAQRRAAWTLARRNIFTNGSSNNAARAPRFYSSAKIWKKCAPCPTASPSCTKAKSSASCRPIRQWKNWD